MKRSGLHADSRDGLNVAMGLIVGLVIVGVGIITTRGMQDDGVEPEPFNYTEGWREAMRGFLKAGEYAGFSRDAMMQYGVKKTTWETLRDVLLAWQGELDAAGEGATLARFGQGYTPYVNLVLAHEAMNTRVYPKGPPPDDEMLRRWARWTGTP
jgi:hypothetical protein